MVEIGGWPILVHLMRLYADHGFKEFTVACGYRGDLIKDYFHNFSVRHSDYRIDLADGSLHVLKANAVDWRVGPVDTGVETSTGGRILRLRESLGEAPFMVSYGDGLGDIDITALVAFHRAHGRIATVTAVRPPARFGGLTLDGPRVSEFAEKPQIAEGWINGGFFVFEPRIFAYLREDQPLEFGPLERLAAEAS